MDIFETFPTTIADIQDWEWADLQPFVEALLAHELTADSLDRWLRNVTAVSSLVQEHATTLHNRTSSNTADEDAEKRLHFFLDHIRPNLTATENQIQKKFLASGLEPPNFSVPLQKMRAEVALFREANIPLKTEEAKLANAYQALAGKQTVDWDGKTITISQLRPFLRNQDREIREDAWRLRAGSYMEHQVAFNDIWTQMMALRKQIATNAGYADYRDYMWQEKLRFDYTPEDALAFCDSVEQVVVPVAERLMEKQRQKLRVDCLRPWDIVVDPFGREPLKPFDDVETMMDSAQTLFDKMDDGIGSYYKTLRAEGLLDLDNRQQKAPGGYHSTLPLSRRSFIFANSVGLQGDVGTLVHEMGHAYHAYQKFDLPYVQQWNVPMEFNEVASMALELLAMPYYPRAEGGFYDDAEAARAKLEHLTELIQLWVYIARGVRFQHWIYTNHEVASDPVVCDEKWLELTKRFMKGVDHTGLEDQVRADWRGTLHFFLVPFYMIEYGMAQMGAVQIWKNALTDKVGAFDNYRKALTLGGTVSLPELYETAGATFDFSPEVFQSAMDLIEASIIELDAIQS
ncbi:MAG: M3 family oligoendopeptidase [Aggregatilineales bacterium]